MPPLYAMMETSTERAKEMSETFIWTHSIINRTPTLVIVAAVFMTITTFFFASRVLVRSKIRQWGWDDLIAIIAYCIIIVQTSFLFTAAHHGFGKHRADIPAMFSTAMFWFWLYQILYKILGAFTKLTFCVLYLRLFPQRLFRQIVYGVSAIIAIGSFAFMMGTIFQCSPVRRNWDKSLPGSCINFNAFWYTHAVFNTFMDVVVFVLPIPMIKKLNMDRRSRWGLASIFLLGAFTIVASIIRMTELYGSATSQTDPTWGSTTALIWTEVEANTAVICCCLPALRQAAINLWRRLLGKTGPETPAAPSTGHGQLSAAHVPGKPWGTYVDVHHSSPRSMAARQQDAWTPLPAASAAAGPSRWSKWKLSRGKQLSNIEDEGLELGNIERRRDINVQSERISSVQPPIEREPGFNPFDLTIEEFLQRTSSPRR